MKNIILIIVIALFGYAIQADKERVIKICRYQHNSAYGGYDHQNRSYYCVNNNKIITIK